MDLISALVLKWRKASLCKWLDSSWDSDDGSDLESSKQQKTLYSFGLLLIFLKREFKELTCHHLFPRKNVCNFLGSPVTTCKTTWRKVSNWSHAMTGTNCQMFISHVSWMWHKKQTSDCGIVLLQSLRLLRFAEKNYMNLCRRDIS